MKTPTLFVCGVCGESITIEGRDASPLCPKCGKNTMLPHIKCVICGHVARGKLRANDQGFAYFGDKDVPVCIECRRMVAMDVVKNISTGG